MSETEQAVDRAGDGTERSAIHVDTVDVRRAPGFESGGPSLDGLSPGVNVVCGGNAAGKTTLSKAIRWSLWPDSSDVPARTNVETEFTHDGEGWRVVLNDGAVRHFRDGADTSSDLVPSLDGSERYELPLEELLQPQSDGETFADAIRQQSMGGFDVSAVREDLGLEDGASPCTRGISETQAAADAVEEVERRRREEPDLSAECERLADVEERLQAAADARDRAVLLERAVAFAEARDEYREADDRVEKFPAALSTFDGDEIEKLEDLEAKIARHEAAVWDAATTDRDAAAEMAETGLDDPVPASTLETLRECREELGELESDRDRLERECDAAKTRRAEAREKIPLDLDADTLRAVETEELDDLREFLRAVGVAEEAERAQSEIETAFETVTETDVVADRDALVAGRDALAAWLAEPDEDDEDDAPDADTDGDGLRRAAVGAGLLVAAGGVAVGLTGNPLGFLLALVGVAQAVYAWTTGDENETADDQTAPDPREPHRQRFPDGEIASPTAWTREAVRERLSEIRESLAAVETADTAADTREQLQAKFAESGAADRVEETRERLRESLGVDPDDGDELKLGVAVERIERWQAADEELSAKRAELQTTREQIDTRLSEFRERIAPYDTDDEYAVETAADVVGVIESLQSRSDRYRDAHQRRDRVEGDVAAARDRLAEVRDDYESLFTDRGLTVGDEERLRELAEQHDDYTDAVDARKSAETKLEQRRTDLEGHDGYDPDEELEDRAVGDLESELSDVRDEADEHDELLERKNDLENKINSAKASTDVETAVDERDEALEALEDALERDAGDAVADELLDAVAETAATRQRPVFRRADELLRAITNGAFELRLEDGVFRAYDTGEDRRVDLDDLSTGTRVQVLLSVRVAFVEHREGDTAPPLLLDDTLAVFDDLRAEEVIETVIGFARQGRQVFYFTARNDERERLRERLTDAGVDHAIRSLDGVYDDDPTAREPRVDIDPPTADVPAPDGDDHDAYRERLDVPTFDPRKGAQRAHLWYVTEEPEVLYDLLSVRIDNWGQLKSLLDAGLVDGLLSTDARDRIRRHGAALEAFTDAFTVGRGDPIDREVLEDSEAVSDTFIDEVSDLAERANGDPERVLDGLPDVNHFRTQKIEELREYLREEGYLDPRETRSPEEIRIAVANAYADHGSTGREADAAARRLLERVGGTEEPSDAR